MTLLCNIYFSPQFEYFFIVLTMEAGLTHAAEGGVAEVVLIAAAARLVTVGPEISLRTQLRAPGH